MTQNRRNTKTHVFVSFSLCIKAMRRFRPVAVLFLPNQFFGGRVLSSQVEETEENCDSPVS